MKSMFTTIVLSTAVAFGLGRADAFGQHEHEHEHEHAHHHEHDHGAGGRGEEAGHSHERAEVHGGTVTMSKEFHIETVFLPDQVRLYLYDAEQNPMHFKYSGKGLVTANGELRFRNRARRSEALAFTQVTPGGYACPMHADQNSTKPGECAKCGMSLVKQKLPEGTLWSCPMHPDENGNGPGRCADCGMRLTPQDYLVAEADFDHLKAGDARISVNLVNLPGAKEKTLQFTEKFTPGHEHDDADEHADHEHGDHDHDRGDHDH